MNYCRVTIRRDLSLIVALLVVEATLGISAIRVYASAAASPSLHERAELTASDAAPDDNFGASVAVSGSTAAVGAYDKDTATGAVYIFVKSGTAWSEQAKVVASDAAQQDLFGISVAVSGSTLVVGARGKNSFAGAAYVYVRSGTTWSQQAELTASDAATNDEFGSSVALSGSTVVVGAFGRNSETGAAYVFLRSGTTWTQQAILTASDAATDAFGLSVGISGSSVVVGAPRKNSDAGSVYVFLRSGASWSERAELTAADGVAQDQFGRSVAVSDLAVLVGAPWKNFDKGASYVFVRTGATWLQQAELTASDAAQFDSFGIAVALSGSAAVVGADQLLGSAVGAAYVFVASGTGWTQQSKLSASDGAPFDIFGSSVAISGSTVVGGAAGHNSFAGSAYVFVPKIPHTWVTRASMPTARQSLAAAPSGTKVFAIGGQNGTGDLTTVEAYDTTANSWSSRASMPTARSGLAAAAGPDGKLYAIGGFQNGSPLATLEVYDPGTKQWSAKAPMPTARGSLAAATGADGRIYAIGGYNSKDGSNHPIPLATVEAYDPATNTWAMKAAMPTARYWLAAAAGGGKIYALGGENQSTTSLQTAEAYDPGTDSWTPIAPMPSATDPCNAGLHVTGRNALAAVGTGTKIYAAGGTQEDFVPLCLVQSLTLATGVWAAETPMATARGNLAGAASGGKAYAFGGYSNGYLATVERY